MEYCALRAVDVANVAALNRAYARHLRREAADSVTAQTVALSFRPLLAELTELHIEHLAEAPFLLFSLRETDARYWSNVFGDARTGDLFAGPSNAAASRIVTASLAYLWQLADRNPYAARLVSGATLTWCEQLAQSTLYKLLCRAQCEPSMLEPRLADNTAFWHRLLSTGLHSDRHLRRAAHISALQIMLTGSAGGAYRQLPAAACQLPSRHRQLVE